MFGKDIMVIDNYSFILLFFIIVVMILIQLKIKEELSKPKIRNEYLEKLKSKIEFEYEMRRSVLEICRFWLEKLRFVFGRQGIL